jgi:hypothetical protein
MPISFKETMNLLEDGTKSEYYNIIADIATILTEEQMALMSIICTNANNQIGFDALTQYIIEVEKLQALMPGTGKVKSRQILCLVARMAGID